MAAAAAELKQMQQQREQPPQLSNMVEAGPDLAAQLQVTVEPSAGYPGKQCRGAIQVVRWMPECAKDGRDGCIKPWKNKEHFLNYALLRPLLRAQEAALVAQAEGLDLERRNRTFATLMGRLLEMAEVRVHKVELTPATVGHLIPEGPAHRQAELAEWPEGLRELKGEL